MAKFFAHLSFSLKIALVAMLFANPAYALQNEFSFNAKIEAIPSARSLVIRHEDDRYLIHVKRGCSDQLKLGRTVNITQRDHLDGNKDVLRTSAYYQCKIDFAAKVNEALYVSRIYADKTSATVSDEKGDEYFINFGRDCRAITSQLNNYVYADVYRKDLSASDKMYIPGKFGSCTLKIADKLNIQGKKSIKKAKTADRKIPTTVTNVKAVSGNKSAYLYFKKAKDNDAISHYLVSVSRYKIDARERGYHNVSDMPNRFKVTKNRVQIKGLRNNQTYYFYVMAVDKSGNVSSQWSLPAKVHTSAALPLNRVTTSYATNARKDGTPARD